MKSCQNVVDFGFTGWGIQRNSSKKGFNSKDIQQWKKALQEQTVVIPVNAAKVLYLEALPKHVEVETELQPFRLALMARPGLCVDFFGFRLRRGF